MRKLTALIAAATLALTALAPAAADARDRRGDGWGHYDHRYDGRHYRHRDRDNGDAVAAGAVGLILGLAIGSIASQPRQAPPPRYYDQRSDDGPPPGYYDDRGSAYGQDYGYAPGYYDEPPIRARCARAERHWDSYAGRYVIVDVPC